MAKHKFPTPAGIVNIIVERLEQFKGADLDELCQAAEATIDDEFGFTIGFSRHSRPTRQEFESYFRGVLMVPGRALIVSRVDGVIAGSIQLVCTPANHSSKAFAAQVENHFVVPWARGHGLAKLLLDAAEQEATKRGCSVIRLDVRTSLEPAIYLYESAGYTRWGSLEKYELINGQYVGGHFYYKDL